MALELVKFGEQAPADSISAADLDANFSKLALEDKQGDDAAYTVSHGEYGQSIEPNKTILIFDPQGNIILAKAIVVIKQPVVASPGTSGKWAFGMEEGSFKWFEIKSCEEA